jgi:hypothetical protein
MHLGYSGRTVDAHGVIGVIVVEMWMHLRYSGRTADAPEVIVVADGYMHLSPWGYSGSGMGICTCSPGVIVVADGYMHLSPNTKKK